MRAPYNNVDALRKLLKEHTDVVAILVEPVQGEAGVRIPHANYLSAIRALCDEHDCLMIVDDIQGCMGRTGKWFSFQHTNVLPDIVTIAKGLANGLPIGACLAGEKAASLFQYGNHGSTFGGNALATRVASEVIRVIEEDHLLENATQRGQQLVKELRFKLSSCPRVRDIRGLGLWIGIELENPSVEDILSGAKQAGLLLNVTQDTTIRLAPPLIISPEEIILIAEKVSQIVRHTPSRRRN